MTPPKNVHQDERIGLRGEVQLVLQRADGGVRRIAVRNTIVYLGRTALLQLLRQALGGSSAMGGTPGHLVPGTNGTPPTVGDVGLGAPLGPSDRVALTNPNLTLNAAAGELVVTGTLLTTQGNGSTLREIGLELANGDLFARQVHPAVPKTSMLSVSYTWRIAFTS